MGGAAKTNKVPAFKILPIGWQTDGLALQNLSI